MMFAPSRNFLVVAHPRTGTNYLCNMIANREDVYYRGEYHPTNRGYTYNTVKELFYGDPEGLKWGRAVPPASPRCGSFAKMFYYMFVWPHEDSHFTRWDVIEYIKRKRIGVIHLRRKNLLDTALSYILANREKNYIYKPYRDQPIEITPSYLKYHLWLVDWQTQATQEAFEKADVRRLDLWYDEMIADPQGTADRVADYLQRPRKEIVIGKATVKQRKGRQRDYVLHYDRLKEKLADTPYAQYFVD